MPKRTRKKNTTVNNTSDFTIADYANSSVSKPSSRLKKDGRMLQEPINWNWDDNVDDDIDLIEMKNDDGSTVFVVTKSTKEIYKTHHNFVDVEGYEYPIDIWYQISKYILPEDVGRFAGICHATMSITHSAPFWFHMYKKYYKNKYEMPDRLKPEQMTIRCGLRACVIRTLFFIYSPFMSKANLHNFYTPKNLLKRKCLSMWYEKLKDHWIFFFKFKLTNSLLYRIKEPEKAKKNIFDILDNVMVNSEDDCKILKVYCGNFLDGYSPVMGMILNVIFTKVSPDMRNNRLNLGFNKRPDAAVQECNMVLNSVLKMEVLDWWHPDYPHYNGVLPISVISNSDKSVQSADYS